MSSLIMWITFCQETKVDKTRSLLTNKANAFKKFIILLYLRPMEKFRKIKKLKRKRKHGFLERSKTHGGKKVLKKRRANKRAKLTV